MNTAPHERRLFKSGTLHGNVVLNFTHSPKRELAPQGEAYYRAGRLLATHLLEQPGYSDLDAYPIVFLYRQALELMFKAILLYGNDLASLLGRPELATSEKTLFTQHSLSNHLPLLEQIFRAVGWDDAFDGTGLSNPEFVEAVNEFQKYDPGSYAFRYTVKRDGSAALPEHFIFSVARFMEVMNPILEALYGATLGLYEHVQAEMESRFETQSQGEWTE